MFESNSKAPESYSLECSYNPAESQVQYILTLTYSDCHSVTFNTKVTIGKVCPNLSLVLDHLMLLLNTDHFAVITNRMTNYLDSLVAEGIAVQGDEIKLDKAKVKSSVSDFAEGRISVEEVLRRIFS